MFFSLPTPEKRINPPFLLSSAQNQRFDGFRIPYSGPNCQEYSGFNRFLGCVRNDTLFVFFVWFVVAEKKLQSEG
jgi:hypothetical protein